MRQGLIHIYCGDGKGKTTAAVGLAVRAAGSGMQVLFTQFLKNDSSGELYILDQLSQIECIHLPGDYGFFRTLTPQEQTEVKTRCQLLWKLIKDKIQTGNYELLVIDELMAACSYGLIEENEVVSLLQDKPYTLEVVMTGRSPSARIMDLADYISEIKKIKHPFDQNIGARKGIEF